MTGSTIWSSPGINFWEAIVKCRSVRSLSLSLILNQQDIANYADDNSLSGLVELLRSLSNKYVV